MDRYTRLLLDSLLVPSTYYTTSTTPAFVHPLRCVCVCVFACLCTCAVVLPLRAANITGNIHNRMCQDFKTQIFATMNCFSHQKMFSFPTLINISIMEISSLFFKKYKKNCFFNQLCLILNIYAHATNEIQICLQFYNLFKPTHNQSMSLFSWEGFWGGNNWAHTYIWCGNKTFFQNFNKMILAAGKRSSEDIGPKEKPTFRFDALWKDSSII